MFTEHTKVLVQGKGYTHIKNFSGYVDIWDGESFVDANVSEPTEAQICRVSFKGGHEVQCSPEQQFAVLTKKGTIFVEAQDLKYPHNVLTTTLTPKFDFLPKLENYTSWEQGFCHALVHVYNNGSKLVIPADEFELIKQLKEILYKNQCKYFTAVKHKHTKMDTVFTFADKKFMEQFTKIVPSFEFDKSKTFAEGYLKVYLNTAKVVPNTFLQCVGRYTNLKAVQEILYLFTIKSTVTHGLLNSTLTIRDESLLRLHEIAPIFKNKNIINSIDATKTNLLINRQRKPLTLAVANVKMENEASRMYEITNSDSFKVMANGIVANSRRSN